MARRKAKPAACSPSTCRRSKPIGGNLRSQATPAECAAVVKGDGYGCGLEPVAAQLYQAGCTTFFVADLSEAKRARAVAREATIYILNGMPPGTAPVFAEHYLQPVIGNTSELAEWDMFCSSSGWHGGFALHVDTGMNRLGVTIDEAAAIAPRLSTENHGMTLLMSHLVSAEAPDNARNHEQILGFREIRRMFRGIPASLANSSGIFLGRCGGLRHGPPRRRAVRPQSDARKAKSDAARGRTQGAHRAAAPGRGRTDRRLQCDLDGAAAVAHRHTRRRLCRRLFPRRERRRQQAGRPRPRRLGQMPDRRPHLDGPDGDRHHRSAAECRQARRISRR